MSVHPPRGRVWLRCLAEAPCTSPRSSGALPKAGFQSHPEEAPVRTLWPRRNSTRHSAAITGVEATIPSCPPGLSTCTWNCPQKNLLNTSFPKTSTTRTLRQRTPFQLSVPNTSLFQSSPLYFASHTFNNLPPHIRSINTLPEFKRKAQQHILSYSCPCSRHLK